MKIIEYQEKLMISDCAGNVYPYPEGIKTAKKRLGLTYPQLAEKLGVNPSTVESWAYNRRTPSKSCMLLLDRLLKDSSVENEKHAD